MDFPDPHYHRHDGLRLAFYQAGDPAGEPLLLVHGWPEIAYSWAPLIPHLRKYRLVMPDLRGFNRSDAPHGAEHYGIAQMVGDLEALLDHLRLPHAIWVGHDWGGIVVWHAARMTAQRVARVVSICTPHVRRAPVDPVAIYRKRHGEDHYFVHFNDRPGVADALFAQNPLALFRLMMRGVPDHVASAGSEFTYIPKSYAEYLEKGAPPLKGAVMGESDMRIYADAYVRSGWHGGINLYRNTGANWELAEGLSDRIAQPTLMISPERDLLLPPKLTEPMVDMIPDLTRVTLPDCGHWAMWEKPREVSAAISDWMGT